MTEKIKYHRVRGGPVEEVTIDAALVRGVLDNDDFARDINQIASRYRLNRQFQAEQLTDAQLAKTAAHLHKSLVALAENLDELPESLEAMLWQLRLEWRDKGIDLSTSNGLGPPYGLNYLLHDFAAELGQILATLPKKAGNRPSWPEWAAARALGALFTKHDLPLDANVYTGKSAAISLLGAIFEASGNYLSDHALASYLKKKSSQKTDD